MTTTTVDDCKTTEECRTLFGVGRICAASGLCEPAPPNARCGTTFPPDVLLRPENYPNILLVGSLFDRSIPSQISRERGIQLAVTQVNEQQGLDGRLFGVVLCDISKNAAFDGATRTEAAVASSRYLTSVIGVSAIIGPSASADTLAVFESVKNDDIVVISPASTSPTLTSVEPSPASDSAPGRLWRTAPPDTLQGIAIVRHLRAAFPAATSVALVQEKGAYGDALAEIFTKAFQAAGGTVQAFPFANSGERDAAIVQAGALRLPFVLFFSSQSTDSVSFINAASGLDNYTIPKTQLFLTDSSATESVVTAARDKGVFTRVLGSRPAVPPGVTLDLFKTSFTGAFNGEDPSKSTFVAHTYDATWMAIYGTARALRQEGRVTGTGIARGLRKLSDGGPEIPVAPSSWKVVADKLGSGGSVNIVGASGQLDFDAANEETTAPVEIWKIAADAKTIEAVTNIDPR